MYFKPGQDIPLYGNLSNQFNSIDNAKSFNPIGTTSNFTPATNLGLGPGIAQENFGFIERYRAGEHEKFGEDHVNFEIFSPIISKPLKPLINFHIDMKDD